jgi:hypothetical protein
LAALVVALEPVVAVVRLPPPYELVPAAVAVCVITASGRKVVNGAAETLKLPSVLSTGICVAKLGFGWLLGLSGERTLSKTCMTPFASKRSEVSTLAELMKNELDEKLMEMVSPFTVSKTVPFSGKEVEYHGPPFPTIM